MNAFKFKDVSHVIVRHDGKAITLDMNTETPMYLGLEFTSEQLHELITSLTEVAYHAAQARNPKPTPLPADRLSKLSTAKASQVAIAENDSQLFLVVRIQDFDLSFQVERPIVESLSGTAARVLKDTTP